MQHGLLPREQAEKWMKENKKALATKSPSKATARPPAQRKSTGAGWHVNWQAQFMTPLFVDFVQVAVFFQGRGQMTGGADMGTCCL